MSDVQRRDWFWGIVDRTTAAGDDQDAQAEALAQELRGLTPDEIERFATTFDELLTETYSWDLWGAAYVVEGGCSDDGFEYFRVWMLSRGRRFFEAARTDPDSLAELIPADYEEAPDFELLAYVASDVWSQKTGKSPEDMPGRPQMAYDGDPSGKPFTDDEAHLRARYPRLWARFGDGPLG